MSEKEKKSADEILKIIEEILYYNKKAQKTSSIAANIDEPNPEESIVKRVKLRRQKLNTIEEKEKKTINCLVVTLTIQAQAICSVD